MMAKRVIPCLDVHAGQVTRGVQFGRAEAGELRNVGDPVELALRYNEQGADEMVFFDITASAHGRATMVDVIQRAADQCFMPLTVGGGLKSVEDMYTMLRAGADKVSINSSALSNPDLIRAGAEKFRVRLAREIAEPLVDHVVDESLDQLTPVIADVRFAFARPLADDFNVRARHLGIRDDAKVIDEAHMAAFGK